jgi:hypothetical protein
MGISYHGKPGNARVSRLAVGVQKAKMRKKGEWLASHSPFLRLDIQRAAIYGAICCTGE